MTNVETIKDLDNRTFQGVCKNVISNNEKYDCAHKRISQVSKGFIPEETIREIIELYGCRVKEPIVHLVCTENFTDLLDRHKFSFNEKTIITKEYRIGAIRNMTRYGDKHQTIYYNSEVHILLDIPKLVSERNITTPLSVGLNYFKLNVGKKRVICDGINIY